MTDDSPASQWPRFAMDFVMDPQLPPASQHALLDTLIRRGGDDSPRARRASRLLPTLRASYIDPLGKGTMIMRRRLQMNGRNDRMTETMGVVLAAVVNGGGRAWGFSICEQTGLATEVVYPVLDKLMAAGVITDRWEDPAPEDRDPRRYYDPAFDSSWYVANGLLPEAP